MNGGKFLFGTALVAAVSGIIATAITTEASPITGLATLSGVVIDSGTGRPISGAQVILGLLSLITGSNGAFVFEGIAPGTYNFSISAPGYQTVNL